MVAGWYRALIHLASLILCTLVGAQGATASLPNEDEVRLVNLSTRGVVGTGDEILIGGIIVEGASNILIRGVGPSLESFGVSGAIADPQLLLFDASQSVMTSNTDWRLAISGPGIPEYAVEDAPIEVLDYVMVSVGAFPLQSFADTSLYLHLAPGLYTVQLASQSGSRGVGLNEVYLVPESIDPFSPGLRIRPGSEGDDLPPIGGLAPNGCIDEARPISLRLTFDQPVGWEVLGNATPPRKGLEVTWHPTRTDDIRHGQAGWIDSRGWTTAPRYEKTAPDSAVVANLVTVDAEGGSFIEECSLTFLTPGSGSMTYRWGTISGDGSEVDTELGQAEGSFTWSATTTDDMAQSELGFFRVFPKATSDGRPSTQWAMRATDFGPVLPHGDGPEGSDINGAREVVVTQADGQYVMHYDGCGVDGWLACRAISSDLLTWEKQGPIMAAGPPGSIDAGCVCSPWTIFDGSIWHMFYLATPDKSPPPDSIPLSPYTTRKARAPSMLGPWTKQPDIEPIEHSPGPVSQIGDTYYQYFTAAHQLTPSDPILRTLGLASTSDLDTTWSIETDQLLPPDEQIENASIYYEPENGLWFIFTNHVGVDGSGWEATDAVWVYWSDNPFAFDPRKKVRVMDAATSTWARGAIGMPSVVPVGDRLALFYDGNAKGSYGHMERDIGLAFIDLPLHPPAAIGRQ